MGWTPVPFKLSGVALRCYSSHKHPEENGCQFKLGDNVNLVEENGEWFRAFVDGRDSTKGIIPKNLVLVRCNGTPLADRVNRLEADPLATEMTSVLREWGDIWKRLYIDGKTFECNTLRRAIEELINWRKQIIGGRLTLDQMRDIRNKIVQKMNWGNRKLGLDFVPRVDEKVASSSSTGLVKLYQVHLHAKDSALGSSSETHLHAKDSALGSSSETVVETVAETGPASSSALHLFTTVRYFGLHIGEDIEMYLQLYDASTGKYTSERFLVKISKDVSFSSYLECQHNCSAIFMDLGKPEKLRDMYLVIYLLRCGRIVYAESSKKPATYMHRRPYGCAITSLQEGYGGDEVDGDGRETILRLYQCDDKDFSQLHELLIRKQNSKFSPVSSSNSQGVVLQTSFLSGDPSLFLLEKHSFLNKSAIVRKLGFPEVIMPGDVRNDMYLTLVRAEFEKGNKPSGKNVEVDVKVVLENGETLKGAIDGAVGYGSTYSYSSIVLHHQSNPVWHEMIKLTVPICMIPGIHLRLEYKACSSKEKHEPKLFGFSFLRIMDEEGTVVQDGNHELVVYKCEDLGKLGTPANYLCLPSTPQERHSGSHSEYANLASLQFVRSTKEWAVIEFQLCSTKLTQNSDLLALLKYKSFPDRIIEILSLVSRLRGEEVVKFLQDVLDALFSMFSTEDGVSTPHSGAVFIVLINVLNLLEDSRFEHFKPVVEAYIMDHFSAALAYNGLIRCLKHHASNLPNVERQPQIVKCFRTLDFLSRFIVQSWHLYYRSLHNDNSHLLSELVEDLFAGFCSMMDSTHDLESAHDAKDVFLRNIPSAVHNFLGVIEPPLLARSVSELIDSSGATEASSDLISAKLLFLKSVIATDLFQSDESRGLLLPVLCHHLRLHIAARQELALCAGILGDVLNFFYLRKKESQPDKVSNVLYHDVEVLCLSLMDVLVQTTLNAIDSFDDNLGILEACFLGLLQLMDECHYQRLWEDFGDRRLLRTFLNRILILIRHVVKNPDVFPSDWFVIRLAANAVLLQAIKECGRPLIDFFLEAGFFEPQLWNLYLCLMVSFITQPSLQVETFGESRRKMAKELGVDMRVRLGCHLVYSWSILGDCQISFIPSLVTQFLEVSLIPEPDLRSNTLGVFFEMMECEQKLRGNFKQVESELIEKLDMLVGEGENKGDNEYKELLNTILLEKARNSDLSWRSTCTSFITSLTRLLERLLDYRMDLNGDNNLYKKMSSTYNLLNFYRDEVDRVDMYVRYIYKLHELHMSTESSVEAGLTLLQYASMLKWTSNVVPSDARRPAEVEWKRKEELYLEVIECLDKGKAWERGISLCEELTFFYKKKVFDYAKLPVILRMQATFYEKIMAEVRATPEYFCVGFYGCGFAQFMTNKLFVYRGLEYERVSNFTQRLLMEYPSAKLLTKLGPPGEDVTSSRLQYIQVCTVKPMQEEHLPESDGVSIPDQIRRYQTVNDVRTFLLDRPVRKGGADKDNEFKNLWIERTKLTIESPLPGVLRWFEVVTSCVEEIPPIRVACETVSKASLDLEALIGEYSKNPKKNISPLTMRLQGMIDAAVMGGIAKYQEAFLTNEFRSTQPHFLQDVSQLKQLITEQFRLLEAGLELHSRFLSQELQPLHNRLVECMGKTRLRLRDSGIHISAGGGHRRADSDAGIEYRTVSTIRDTPLPPRPQEHRRPTRSATVSLHPYNSPSSERFSSFREDQYFQQNDSDDYSYITVSPPNCLAGLVHTPQLRSPARQNACDYMPFTLIQNRVSQESETISLSDSGILSLSGEDRARSQRPTSDISRLTPEPSTWTPPRPPPRNGEEDSAIFSQTPPPIYPKRTSRRSLSTSMHCPLVEAAPPLPPKQGSLTPRNNLSSQPRRFEYDTVSLRNGEFQQFPDEDL